MVAKIVPVLFMLIGASVCMLAFYLWYRHTRLTVTGLHATGHVIEWVERECHGDQASIIMYAPVVRFAAVDAGTIEFTDSFLWSDRDRYAIGQEVRVLYDRRDFSHACIDSGISRNIGLAFLLILGLGFLVLGYVGHVLEIRRG